MQNRTTKFASLLAGLVLLISFEAAPAQGMRPTTPRNADEMKIRRAENLVRLGKTSQAIDLYLDVLADNPQRTNLYHRVAELLPGKENAVTLLQILEDVREANPRNHNLSAEQGRLLWILDRREEAISTWNALILERQERFIYSVVTNTMLRAGAMDEAVNLLTDARIALNEPHAFTMELARVYMVQHDYQNASLEYLKHLERTPNTLSHVTNQLLAMLKNEGAAEFIELSFDAVLAGEGDHQAVQLAQAKVYLYLKRYDECLAVVQQLEQEASVHEIMKIANDLRAEKAWQHAAELYLIISASSTESRLRGDALLHLASVYEQQLGGQKAVESLASYYGGNPFFELDMRFTRGNDEMLKRTFELYDSLQTVLPKTHSAMEASYRIADLRLTTSGDVDRAIQGFEQVLANSRNPQLRLKAGKRLVDAWLVRGDAGKAELALNELTQRLNMDEDDPEIIASRIKVLFHRAELPALKKELLNLSGSAMPNHKRFNDALELLSLIEGNGGVEDEEIKSYLAAERMVRQHKLTQAIQLLKDFQGAEASIADEARIRSIQILLALGQKEEAKMEISKFLDEFPESTWRPTALVWMAEQLHYDESDPQAAVSFYEKVIIEHPEFLGISAVRLRLREILGSGS